MKTIVVTMEFTIDDEIDPTREWIDQLISDKINTGEGWWAELGVFVGHEEFEDDDCE